MHKKQPIIKPKTPQIPHDVNAQRKLKTTLGIIIGVFAFMLYVQSVSFKYTLDDRAVIDQNRITRMGFAGIPTLLKTDYWYGFKDELRVPQYRPASVVLFAIVWQFFPDSPAIYHLINVLLYTLICWLLFRLLCKILEEHSPLYGIIFPFVSLLLYVAHPIHTEVVDSIKSCDELLCFLFAILSAFFTLQFVEDNSKGKILLAALCYFLALMSKETSISFLLIIPLALFVFTKISTRKLIRVSMLFGVITLLFFIVRFKVLESISFMIIDAPTGNSLNAAPDIISQKATACYILFRYILLLIFPHPLAYDYSIAQIPLQTLSSLPAMAGIVIYFSVTIYALMNIKKKSPIAFIIFFYLFTLVPVSNIFIIIGSTMGERFMFMPSFSFCIALSFLLIKLTNTYINKSSYTTIKQLVSGNFKLFSIVFIIVGLYSFKTFSRNPDWKNNITLFGHDVADVENNAKAHFNWGSSLFGLYSGEKDTIKQKQYLDKAIIEFTKAMNICDQIREDYFYLAKTYLLKKDYQNVINVYNTFRSYGNGLDAFDFENLAEAFYNLGAQESQSGQPDKALTLFDSTLKFNPNYWGADVNKGVIYLNKGNTKDALSAFENAIKIDSKCEIAYINIGCVYATLKQYEKAIEYLNKATEIDPKDYQPIYYLGMAYQQMGDPDKAQEYLDKASKMSGGQQK